MNAGISFQLPTQKLHAISQTYRGFKFSFYKYSVAFDIRNVILIKSER